MGAGQVPAQDIACFVFEYLCDMAEAAVIWLQRQLHSRLSHV